jgi:hypothetical protein
MAGNIQVPTDLPHYIYASQFIQSEALATAYSGWRRVGRPRPAHNRRGAGLATRRLLACD